MTTAASRAHPHHSIDKRVALVTAFHRQVEAVLVRVRVDGVGVVGIAQFLEHVLGAGQPAVSFDDDVRRGFVGGLQHVVGA